MAEWYWYELTENGTVRLLRVFGGAPEVEIPEKIAGQRVTEIGDYCFAEKSKNKAHRIYSEGVEEGQAEETFRSLYRREAFVNCPGNILKI